VDSIFAFIFTGEVVFKFYLYGCKGFFCGEDWRWNYFELVLVVIAILEIVIALLPMGSDGLGQDGNVMALVRIVRLLRISRLLKVMKMEALSDLTVMVQGTLGGMKTLVWSTVMLSLPVYIVGLVLRETLGNHFTEAGNLEGGAENFRTLPQSIFTTYRCLVAGDCSDTSGRPIFYLVVERYGWVFALIYCATTLFMTFGLFNVIISIFIENVLAAAKANSRILKRQRLRDKRFYAQKMTDLVRIIMIMQKDLDVSREDQGHMESKSPEDSRSMMGCNKKRISMTTQRYTESDASVLVKAEELQITPELFEMLKDDEMVSEIFCDLDIADDDQFNLFETLDVDGGGTIDMEELFAGVAKLRGEAKKSDIVSLNFMIQTVMDNMEELTGSMTERFDTIDKKIAKMRHSRSTSFMKKSKVPVPDSGSESFTTLVSDSFNTV